MAVIYGCSKYARAFVPGRPIQPSQMFVSKAKAYPYEAPFSCYTMGLAHGFLKSLFLSLSQSLTHTYIHHAYYNLQKKLRYTQHQTRLEGSARDKHSSVLRTFVIRVVKSIIRLGPDSMLISISSKLRPYSRIIN